MSESPKKSNFAKRLAPLALCLGVGIVSFVLLDFYSTRNAPLYKELERQWHEDVETLEASGKLPKGWFAAKELEIYGGTPETKSWLKRIKIPLKSKDKGEFRLEVLVVAWEEEGIIGALVQYNLIDLKSKNMIWELGRTLTLRRPRSQDPWKSLLEDLRQ